MRRRDEKRIHSRAVKRAGAWMDPKAEGGARRARGSTRGVRRAMGPRQRAHLVPVDALQRRFDFRHRAASALGVE